MKYKIFRRPTDMPNAKKIHWILWTSADTKEEAEEKVKKLMKDSWAPSKRSDWDIRYEKEE